MQSSSIHELNLFKLQITHKYTMSKINTQKYILRKTIEGYLSSFDNIIFDNTILNKAFSYLIELPICNLAKCKIKFTGHWLRYSTTPNVLTLFTQSSQAKNLAFLFLLQPLSGRCLCSNTDHRQVFTPIFQKLHLIT